jgi:5-methylcytosine-specific restriction endonuclease McrA
MCSPRGVAKELEELKIAVMQLAGSSGVAEYLRILRQHGVQTPKEFSREVYKHNSLEALEINGWGCARCRSSRRLQIHHRRFRSQGGTHRLENLEPVCWDCHKVIHQLERSA